ncbi:MAG: metal ABC transporter substrate-binding protein [Planctomycetaceae bacterium]
MHAGLRVWGLTILLPGVLLGCSQPDSGSPGQGSPGQVENSRADRPRIMVTSRPLLEITETLVNAAADVTLVVPDGTSSFMWSPSADDARKLQQAALILISGAGYEPWKSRVALPGSRLRDTASGYYDQFIRIPDAITHQHGPDGKHSHPGTVWATWLDPNLCIAQVHAVSLSCKHLLPEHTPIIEAAEAKLSAEINALNPTIATLKATTSDEPILVVADTPHYQYLIERLGWKLQYLHWGLEETLSKTDRAEFLTVWKNRPGDTRGIFLMDSRRSEESAAFVRESGAVVVRIDLCETRSPESVSFPVRLKSNLLSLQAGLQRSRNSEADKGFFPKK